MPTFRKLGEPFEAILLPDLSGDELPPLATVKALADWLKPHQLSMKFHLGKVVFVLQACEPDGRITDMPMMIAAPLWCVKDGNNLRAITEEAMEQDYFRTDVG